MKMSYKLLFSLTAFFFLSVVTYAAQEASNPGYKPKESPSNNNNTESTTILIFKAPVVNDNGSIRKAGRAERTTAVPSINRLKADNRKTVILSMNA